MTLADLYRATLENLTVVAAGEPADPGDVVLIATRYQSVYDLLAGLKLVTWSLTDAVPEFAVLPLTVMISFASARDFGKNPGDFIDGAIGLPQQQLAERQLRQQLARDYVSAPAQSEYF